LPASQRQNVSSKEIGMELLSGLVATVCIALLIFSK